MLKGSISGLVDITDNSHHGDIVKPKIPFVMMKMIYTSSCC